jgi:hypothetical protein
MNMRRNAGGIGAGEPALSSSHVRLSRTGAETLGGLASTSPWRRVWACSMLLNPD